MTGRWHEQRAGVTGEELLAALVVILAIVPLVYGAAMDVIDGVPPADADRVLTRGASVVVLVEPDSVLPLQLPRAGWVPTRSWPRAFTGNGIAVHLRMSRTDTSAPLYSRIGTSARPAELHLHVGGRGLCRAAPPELNDLVRRSVAPLEGGPEGRVLAERRVATRDGEVAAMAADQAQRRLPPAAERVAARLSAREPRGLIRARTKVATALTELGQIDRVVSFGGGGNAHSRARSSDAPAIRGPWTGRGCGSGSRW